MDPTARFDDSHMSELTRPQNYQQQLYTQSEPNAQDGFPQAVISEIEADDTEFTEQFDLSMHNISHEQEVEVVNQVEQSEHKDDEQKTVLDDASHDGQRS